MNVAIYCRVSSPGAVDKYGMDTQEAECRVYAAERGWTVTHLYREFASGADLFERKQMEQLRAAMKRREFDVLLVHRLDRLSRDVNHQGYVLSEAEQVGVEWASATEPDLDESPMGAILRAIIGAFAQMDRLKIEANTRRGRRKKAEKGRPLGQGKPHYGLAWADVDKTHCVEDPATIGHLGRIFADYDRGVSLRSLALALEADGVLPPFHARTGKTAWSTGSLRGMLCDPTYIGQGEVFRTVTYRTRNDQGEKVSRHRPRPAEERIPLPAGTFPVVIDPAQFARVQARLATNRRESQRHDRNPDVALLRRGYAVCGGCGHPLMVKTTKDTPTYKCHADGRRTWGCPVGQIGMRVAELDAAIWSWLTAELADEDRVRWHLAHRRDGVPETDDLTGIERHLAAIEKQQANLAQAVAVLDDNPDGMAPLIARLDALGKQRRAAERDRAEALARQERRIAVETEIADISAHCRQIAETMAHAMDYAERRQLINLLKVKVTLYPASQTPRWTATSVITPEGVPSGKLFSNP